MSKLIQGQDNHLYAKNAEKKCVFKISAVIIFLRGRSNCT